MSTLTMIVHNLKDELFTWSSPDLGSFVLNVTRLRRAIQRGMCDASGIRLQIREEDYKHILEHGGVERERIDALTPEQLESKVGILIEHDDGTETMVDGNHTLCRLYQDGAREMNCWLVASASWKRFVCGWETP